jgi:hypothetical protein
MVYLRKKCLTWKPKDKLVLIRVREEEGMMPKISSDIEGKA